MLWGIKPLLWSVQHKMNTADKANLFWSSKSYSDFNYMLIQPIITALCLLLRLFNPSPHSQLWVFFLAGISLPDGLSCCRGLLFNGESEFLKKKRMWTKEDKTYASALIGYLSLWFLCERTWRCFQLPNEIWLWNDLTTKMSSHFTTTLCYRTLLWN